MFVKHKKTRQEGSFRSIYRLSYTAAAAIRYLCQENCTCTAGARHIPLPLNENFVVSNRSALSNP